MCGTLVRFDAAAADIVTGVNMATVNSQNSNSAKASPRNFLSPTHNATKLATATPPAALPNTMTVRAYLPKNIAMKSTTLTIARIRAHDFRSRFTSVSG